MSIHVLRFNIQLINNYIEARPKNSLEKTHCCRVTTIVSAAFNLKMAHMTCCEDSMVSLFTFSPVLFAIPHVNSLGRFCPIGCASAHFLSLLLCFLLLLPLLLILEEVFLGEQLRHDSVTERASTVTHREPHSLLKHLQQVRVRTVIKKQNCSINTYNYATIQYTHHV